MATPITILWLAWIYGMPRVVKAAGTLGLDLSTIRNEKAG